MTHPSPRAIEAISQHLVTLEYGRHANLESLTASSQTAYREDATSILTALEAEGLVVVPKHITDKMICAVIDATDKKHSPLSCTEFWDVALQAAQGGDDAGQ